MYSETRRTRTSRWPPVLILVAAAAAFYAGRPAGSTGEAATPAPQDLMRLESRLGQLEQRFYTVELSIRGLEQQARLSSAAPRAGATRDPEVGLLRSEVEALRLRLAEVECGLLKMDERTLTPEAREARRKSAAGNADPCRLGANDPLRLPARP
jgi:hypothetical protein